MEIPAHSTNGPPENHATHRVAILHVLAIVLVGSVLLTGCWNADFLDYDDRDEVFNKHVTGPLSEIFSYGHDVLFFPVTTLSHRLDRMLFQSWLPGRLGTWAPGPRVMNYIYHAGAALILWRVLLLLRFTAPQALFMAMVFCVHPMCCETVCWVAERKNALAGLFGFLALWGWLRLEGHRWRWVWMTVLYLLAICAKPSTLGFLPLFLLIPLFGGLKGLSENAPMQWRSPKAWVHSGACLIPLAAIGLASIIINVNGQKSLVPPPGGSLYTALLTDFEVLARYIFNFFIPIRLSICYFVAPILSLFDLRVLLYGTVLLGLVALTIALAPNRRRAVFGWLWFGSCLGPHLNLIATPLLMQDRYLYLSMPGLLIVFVETCAGLQQRLGSRSEPVFRMAAPVLIAVLALLSIQRSFVWQNTLPLFLDAVEKQPKSVFAHYHLGQEYLNRFLAARENPNVPALEAKALQRKCLEHWRIAADECPDFTSCPYYGIIALNVGEDFQIRGDLVNAEKYWMISAYPRYGLSNFDSVRAISLSWLAALRESENKPRDAYDFANQAVTALADNPTRFLRARLALTLAQSNSATGTERAELIAKAEADLKSVMPGFEAYAQARKMLMHPLFTTAQKSTFP